MKTARLSVDAVPAAGEADEFRAAIGMSRDVCFVEAKRPNCTIICTRVHWWKAILEHP